MKEGGEGGRAREGGREGGREGERENNKNKNNDNKVRMKTAKNPFYGTLDYSKIHLRLLNDPS